MMPTERLQRHRASEDRLDALREEARRTGRVTDRGVTIVGGPIPREVAAVPGYYGLPIVKPPVWTWQIGLYLFVGGTAGMSAVLALVGILTGRSLEFASAALGVGLAGALISPCLLISDLGRPARFFNMLRVFKWRSAMSVGVWTLVLFSGFVGSAFMMVASLGFLTDWGVPSVLPRTALLILASGAAVSGAVLATYTGVLLGATAVPAWSAHYKLLPFHFGIVALGSAAAALELLGFGTGALNAIGLTVSAVETGIGARIELNRSGATARALHEGASGLLLRAAGLLTGPVAFVLRLLGYGPVAAVCFLSGAMLSRYGWVFAGRFSASDPEETIAAQRS
jgi:formate-dependent nitrite reductase membrane component NrfD